MDDLWKCPHCGAQNRMTPQMSLMKEARKHDAHVVGFVRSMDFPCPACARTVNINDLAGGKYDVAGAGGCLVMVVALAAALGGAALLAAGLV